MQTHIDTLGYNAGFFEYEADSIVRFSSTSGYLTVADTVYHLYTPDYQGNIVAVHNTRSGSREHYKEYYPYGLPHAPMPESSSITHVFPSFPGLNPGLNPGLGPIIKPTDPEPEPSSTNRRWYGSKELTTDHGLNTYDFAARHLAPAFPRFTTVDPLATDYHPISPYTYCGGDPINHSDPTGMVIDTSHLSQDQLKLWDDVMTYLKDDNPIFIALYDALEQSDESYTIILTEKIETQHVDEQNGQFILNDNNNGGTIYYREGGFNMDNGFTIIEELCHGYQSEMNYPEGEFNYEFEAKFIAYCSLADKNTLAKKGSTEGLLNILTEVDIGKYSKSERAIDKEGISSLNFLISYMIYSNIYAYANLMKKNPSKPYTTPTYVSPKAIYKLIK